MSRNKYPEETYQRILQVSLQLFITKGYEKTTLNDIIQNLGGLTKGAIYHHFKSKEEILIAVINSLTAETSHFMAAIREDPTLTGKQKLERMFSDSLTSPIQDDLFAVTPNLMENPTFLTHYIKQLFEDTIPNYVFPVILEGTKDGSILTEYPDELASVIIVLTDLWLNPLVFSSNQNDLIKKAKFINVLLEPFNILIFHDAMFETLSQYYELTTGSGQL